MVIPNKQLIGDMLVNHSLYGAVRVNVPVGIAFDEESHGSPPDEQA